MNHEDIARICREANAALCLADGDTSQRPWSEASQSQRDSAVVGVAFCASNPNAPASANHESWAAHKLANGWVYGETKDENAKTHPCLVPFEQLPPHQRAKDVLFKAICGSLLPLAVSG